MPAWGADLGLYFIIHKFRIPSCKHMIVEETIAECERCADIVEKEMPEFAKVLREAIEHIRGWEDRSLPSAA